MILRMRIALELDHIWVLGTQAAGNMALDMDRRVTSLPGTQKLSEDRKEWVEGQARWRSETLYVLKRHCSWFRVN